MGKDLKGKKLEVGICQRKDGLNKARFVSKELVNQFKDISESYRNAINDMQMQDLKINIAASMLLEI